MAVHFEIGKQLMAGLGLILVGALFIFPLLMPRWFVAIVGFLTLITGILILIGKIKL